MYGGDRNNVFWRIVMIYCRYCGNKLLDEALVCPRCNGATPAGEKSGIFQEKKPVEKPNPQPIQQSEQTVIVKTVQKTKIPFIVKVLIFLFALGAISPVLAFVIPTISSQINLNNAFKDAWKCDYQGAEFVFDFPQDKITVEFNDTQVDVNMDWSRKGKVLTISNEESDPLTFTFAFENHLEKMILTNTKDESDVITLTRVH